MSKDQFKMFLSKLSKRYAYLFPGYTKTAMSVLTNLEKKLFISGESKFLFDCLNEESRSSRGNYFSIRKRLGMVKTYNC